MISVIQFSPIQRSQQKSVDHVAEEVGLLRVLTLRHRDVRQHLLLQNLLRVIDSSFSRQCRDRSSTTNEIKSDL